MTRFDDRHALDLKGHVDTEALQRLFDRVIALEDPMQADRFGIVLGDSVIRWGVNTVTWPGGAAVSNTTSVTHGLGRTPIAVWAGHFGTAVATATISAFEVFTPSATGFNVRAKTVDGSLPAAATAAGFAWLAIG